MKPQRIQRKRTKGFNLQAESKALNGLDCVYVGRPTRFGNPFSIKDYSIDEALELFREMVTMKIPIEEEAFDKYRALGIAAGWLVAYPVLIPLHLKGKNLACFCPLDQPCHADILLEIANQ